MNREILFKGKSKISNKWHYGNLVYIKCENKYYIVQYETNVYSVDTDYEYIIKDLDFIEVIPETISQYTDLKDKNGVKIFEHDIVNGITGKPDGNDLIIENMKVTFEYGDLLILEHTNDLEVIGNVFDDEVK